MYFSATIPPAFVGVWMVGDRREQEPGLHLVHHLWTVTDQVRVLSLLETLHSFTDIDSTKDLCIQAKYNSD